MSTQPNEKNLRQTQDGQKEAIRYLQSLPRVQIGPDERGQVQELGSNLALQFVERFRNEDPYMDIPISWSFDKPALIKLLGITSYEHHSAINGIRFYAGVNDDGVMALIAVSTTTGTRTNCTDCRNDLTEADNYPYYDYADPCPTNCSSTGNLSASEEALHRFDRH